MLTIGALGEWFVASSITASMSAAGTLVRSRRDCAADCFENANLRWVHEAYLGLTGEKGGQADVGDGRPGDHKVRAELPFGDATLKGERARRRLPEVVRKPIRFDVQASLGGQSVSEPGPVVQERSFTTFGPVVDGIERKRRLRQHAPLQSEVAVPGPLVGQLLEISAQLGYRNVFCRWIPR